MLVLAASLIFGVVFQLQLLLADISSHPFLLFSQGDIPAIQRKSQHPQLKATTDRLVRRADALLLAPPLLVSLTGRGEPDKPGELKGLEAARRLQGRVLTYCMVFTLSGDRRYREAAVAEMDHAIGDWRIWVDTAHTPPFDLMTGEICLTFGVAYDWLYPDLSPAERERLKAGAERRGLMAYLEGVTAFPSPFWLAAEHNWNPVCNGGAAVLALAFGEESSISERVLELAVPAMKHYWNHLAPDGGWDEGTGYWTYGHRYALIAAEALRRSGKPGGEEVFRREGVRNTGYFPLVFNPGTRLAAGFGDSNDRAGDPILYLLGREFKNPDFLWFQDRETRQQEQGEGWPEEALTLLWRPVDELWLPEAVSGFRPRIDPVATFSSIGWALMAPKQPDPPFFLAFKNGSLAANHTHLDLNHLNVGFGDTMLIVELGSRPYPSDYFQRDRRYQYYEISTAGHNTILIGGKGQVPGKQGRLLGPKKGTGFESLVGVADGTYEVAADRVRRHVVFVNKRYWVVLDEIATPKPQLVEMRFHTYGRVTETRRKHRWTFEQEESALDIVPAMPDMLVEKVELPTGWIKPVRVLSLKTRKAKDQVLIATVLFPRDFKERPVAKVKSHQRAGELRITIGQDEVRFDRSPEGWRLQEVQAESK
jgi:hypothetical protein